MLETRFSIGDLVIALISEPDQGVFSIESSYAKFLTTAEPLVRLRHHFGPPPSLAGWKLLFDSKGVWQLFSQGDQFAVALSSPVFGSEPYEVALFQSDYLSGDLYTSSDYFQPEKISFPLRYPLAEILMINLLGQGRGLLMHACGVNDHGRGLLFSGVSGAGKSTTARLWSAHSQAALLSDDRVILRHQPDGFWIYGTPWHGDAHIAAPLKVPLEKILVLRHAPHNQASRLRPFDLAARLFVRSFPPFWEPAGVQYSLQLLDEVSQAVPGFDFGFLPDAAALDAARTL